MGVYGSPGVCEDSSGSMLDNFIQSQNTCMNWTYIVSNIDSNDLVCLIYKRSSGKN
jgi:hypothetical protein